VRHKSRLLRFIVGLSFCYLSTNGALASSVDCIGIQHGHITEFQIGAQNGFSNCLYVDIPENVVSSHFLAQSDNQSKFNLLELKLNSDGLLSPANEHLSGPRGTVSGAITARGRAYFSVRPLSNDPLSKRIVVNAGIHEGMQVIFFAIQDVIGNTTPPTKQCMPPGKQLNKVQQS